MSQRSRPPYLRLVASKKSVPPSDELSGDALVDAIIPLLQGRTMVDSFRPGASSTCTNAPLFRTYILTRAGSMAGFDRASLLMDKPLLQQTLDAMRSKRETCLQSDVTDGLPAYEIYGAQWVWDDYCERHVEKYAEAFTPDITPGWDDFPVALALSARKHAHAFDTTILTSSGSVMEYDRAVLFLDKTLLQQTLDAMQTEQETCPRWDTRYGGQWVWEYYCQRHLEKYDEYFTPDVIPGWDNSPTPRKDWAR